MDLEAQFLSLSTKFLFINCGGQSSEYRNELNTLLNELNGLDYKNQQISDVRAPIRLVESFVNIPTSEDTLIVKACYLTKTLVSRQKITLPPNVAAVQISWLLKCLERCFYQVICEVLGTLQILMKHCREHVGMFAEFLVGSGGVLVNLLADPDYRRVERGRTYDQSSPGEIYLATVLCLEAFLVSAEGNDAMEKYLPGIGDSIVSLAFRVKSDWLSDASFYGLMISALNCLRKSRFRSRVFRSRSTFPSTRAGRCRKREKRGPLPRGEVPERVKGTAAGKTTGSSWDENSRQPYSEQCFVLDTSFTTSAHTSYRTSDSDFSESESSRAQIDRHKLSKLRLTALTLVGTIAQSVEKKLMFGYWHALFPDESRTPATVSLLNCVLKDPSRKCRIAAIQAISFMVYKSKPFLIQAESGKKTSVSFTPFSVALGNMITEMYEMITQALADESDYSVLTQILKCLTVFIQATPFHRLKPGIVTKFFRFVRILTRHKDPTIKVAALMVMGFLISISEMTPEIAGIVGVPKTEMANKTRETRKKNTTEALSVQFDDEEEELAQSDEELESPPVDVPEGPSSLPKMSWLLQVALENLGVTINHQHKVATPSAVMPVRMECLQVLSAMTGHYSLLADHLRLVADALRNAFNDTIPEIKLYAGRVLDLLGHAINTSLLLKVTIDPDELNTSVDFWVTMLPIVTEQIQDMQQNTSLRTICCDALGNLGVHVFEKLPRDRQIVLVSLLTGCTFDEDSGLSSAAVRALSVYILFPSLRDNILYIENTIEAILRILKEPNVAARVKASWSLGNITDALVLNSSDPNVDKVSDVLMREILEAAIVGAGDNDKVRCNSVRTIGNMLRILKAEHFTQPVWVELCQKSMEKLVQNILSSNNVKVKWNACYSIGNVMRNGLMFSECSRIDWQKQIFPALCQIVINSNNFKVRINASAALSVIDSRSHYGSYFLTVWSSLLKALEQSDNLMDYNEYKHRDNLQEQLCLSLSHFLRLAAKDDLPAMAAELLPLFDAVQQNWDRVVNRILPEKSAKLMEAHVKLQESARNPDVKNAVQMILKCFRSEGHGMYGF
ncbi:hypothetical protein RP20_CCG019819 [Aedes albopictus]|nr:hypothetical protein RP20_CCG019819 [Aedes albopictus]